MSGGGGSRVPAWMGKTIEYIDGVYFVGGQAATYLEVDSIRRYWKETGKKIRIRVKARRAA